MWPPSPALAAPVPPALTRLPLPPTPLLLLQPVHACCKNRVRTHRMAPLSPLTRLRAHPPRSSSPVRPLVLPNRAIKVRCASECTRNRTCDPSYPSPAPPAAPAYPTPAPPASSCYNIPMRPHRMAPPSPLTRIRLRARARPPLPCSSVLPLVQPKTHVLSIYAVPLGAHVTVHATPLSPALTRLLPLPPAASANSTPAPPSRPCYTTRARAHATVHAAQRTARHSDRAPSCWPRPPHPKLTHSMMNGAHTKICTAPTPCPGSPSSYRKPTW